MKELLLQILNSFKILVSYILCTFVVLMYTLFVDGESGILLLAFMILVPIISLIFMLIAKNSVSVELKCSSSDFKKKSPVDVFLKFNKKSILPVPFINVTVGYSPHLCDSTEYLEKNFPQLRVSMAFEKSLECPYRFSSSISGVGRIYIQEAYIYDYLGFFRVKLKDISSSIDIHIIPEVKDINSSQMLFNSICSSVISNDEEEENTQNSTTSIGSTLGYLHREYIQGDSPRRINWKLSCKKDKLMVRLDEPLPQSKPCIVLDMSINKDIPNALKYLTNFESLVESSLALANMCVKNGIECTFTLCNCSNTKEYILTSTEDIYNLAIIISHSVENGDHRLPNSISSLKTSDSMYLVFTDNLEGNLKSEISSLKSRGILIDTVLSPRYYGKYSSNSTWIVNKDLSITQSGY